MHALGICMLKACGSLCMWKTLLHLQLVDLSWGYLCWRPDSAAKQVMGRIWALAWANLGVIIGPN